MQGGSGPAWLVDVLCKSVGVPLAEGRAGGAGAPSLDPAEVVPATSLSGAGRGLPSGGDLAWLQPHGPVLSVPVGMLVGFPGGCGCCSPGWGRNLAEMCGLVACWVGWVLTGDLSGTRTGAVGPTGHSVQGWKLHAGEAAGFLLEYWKAGADELSLSGGRRTVEHKCPAGVPEEHPPVQGTGHLLGAPGLVDEVPHLDQSFWLHPAA